MIKDIVESANLFLNRIVEEYYYFLAAMFRKDDKAIEVRFENVMSLFEMYENEMLQVKEYIDDEANIDSDFIPFYISRANAEYYYASIDVMTMVLRGSPLVETLDERIKKIEQCMNEASGLALGFGLLDEYNSSENVKNQLVAALRFIEEKISKK